MVFTKQKRLAHLFAPDGKSFIVAMDHAGFVDKPLKGLEQPEEMIRCVVHAGADALLLTIGSASLYAEAMGRAGLWLSVDSRPPFLERVVETALRVGADGVKCLAFPWCDEMPDSMTHLAALGADCAARGMPLMAEVIPGGFSAGPEMRTAEKIAAGARMAMEAGADVIKTFYTGDPESCRTVVEYCPVPIVVLGGERSANEQELLRNIRSALDAGAAGVAIGRNIWQHPQPAQLTAALAALIHRGASIEIVAKMLSQLG